MFLMQQVEGQKSGVDLWWREVDVECRTAFCQTVEGSVHHFQLGCPQGQASNKLAMQLDGIAIVSAHPFKLQRYSRHDTPKKTASEGVRLINYCLPRLASPG